ncbi:MAG: flagellar motor switch protein FliN [Planctomycetota bacterium]
MAEFHSGSANPAEPGNDPIQSSSNSPSLEATDGGGGDSAATKTSQPNDDPINQSDIDALLNSLSDETAEPSSFSAVATAPAVPDGRVDSLGRPFDEVAAAMQAAIEEEEELSRSSPPLQPTSFTLPDIEAPDVTAADMKRVTLLHDVNLRVKIELGRTRMLVEDVLRLGEGSVVELDKAAGDPVDVYVNDRLIARGEVLVLNDSFCVRISEVLSHDPHRVGA